MVMISDKNLIGKAKFVVRPKKMASGRLSGDIGAALVTDKGNVYCGVCIETNEGSGICAEYSAVAAMMAAGEYKIERIVAVWTDWTIIPPCGKCRELLWQVDSANWETTVLVGKGKNVKLKELLPYHWHNK